MYQESFIVRTKLTPPRPHKHTLPRPRLTRRLLEALDYRLTLVQAGTGYGKSTALAALAGTEYPLVWYHLDREDADPLLFLLHLIHGCRAALPGLSDAPLALLEAWESNRHAAAWTAVVDALANALAERAETSLFLVLDDAHRLNDAAGPVRILDRLIGRAPANLHTILATRYPIKLPTLLTWRVKGEVLEIGQDELAFNSPEIDALFRERYHHALTLEQAEMLVARVEGWPIALHLIWQRLQRDGGATLPQALGQLSGSAGDLFAYLAQEVLAQQPPDIQDFLRVTAVLRQMTAAVCDCLRAQSDSDRILRYLLESGLFVVGLGDGHVRYHHLFRDLLYNQLPGDKARAAHALAAACYQDRGEDEEAISHLLAAGQFDETAGLLAQFGRRLVRHGRLDTLAGWIEALPPIVLENHPPLLAYLGDIARLHSRFDEALAWYQQAEERSRLRGNLRSLGQALRGQARVYLDTVNPSQAERLLQEALRLSDGQEDRESRARLLELLAENLLNRGRVEAAQRYQAQARDLRHEGPGEAELPVRLLLRTGRLDEARRLLEEQAAAEQQEPVLRPRAHRETPLLLSLILAFQGEAGAAHRCALEGAERGRALDSGFVTAVGYMRQGHAWLLQKDDRGYEEARCCFEEAVALSETLEVPRLKVEAFWGLCQAYGFRGDLETAGQLARQGIDIARSAGDEWIEASIRAVVGAGHVLAADYGTATTWLSQATAAFQECSDAYGETITRLWQCLLWYQSDDTTRLTRDVAELLRLACEHGYDYLFLRRTLLGPPDPRQLVPLLLFARDAEQQATYAGRLLAQLDLAQLEIHPGYQLRVQTLGPFRLWQGAPKLPAGAWRRKKARQLFQLLLTCRHTLLHRDQITDILWPELDPDGAQRDFKIAFSSLCSVLEPERKRNAPSAYVVRDGSRYGLRSKADLWLDAAEFEQLVAKGDRVLHHDAERALAAYQQALALYQGDYLQEYPYEEWCREERERLLALYLRTAERLAHLLLEREAWQEVIDVCQAILARDDCWEQAYRLLMQAYDRMGNRAQAVRTYHRCVERLQTELGVQPAAATAQLYQTLL